MKKIIMMFLSILLIVTGICMNANVTVYAILPNCANAEHNHAFTVNATGDTLTITASGNNKTLDYSCGLYNQLTAGKKITKVIISEGITTISNLTFYGSENLKSITIPSSVTSIANDAFSEVGTSGSASNPELILPSNLVSTYVDNSTSWYGGYFNLGTSTPTLGGSVSVSGITKYNETLTAITSSLTNVNSGTLSYTWKRDTDVIVNATSSTYTLTKDDIDKSIIVTVSSDKATGSISSLGTSLVVKGDSPSAPSGLVGVSCTATSNNDGKITGTTSNMEYSTSSDFSTSKDCLAGETIGISNGTYYVRLKETDTTNAGLYTTITIAKYINTNSPNNNGGSTTKKVVVNTMVK